MCQNRLDPETADFVAVTGDRIKIEGRCECGEYLYDEVRVQDMASYERGGA